MRWIFPALCMLVLAVLLSGCTQPSAPGATPSPTFTPTISIPESPPPSMQAPPAQRQIDVAVDQSGSDIIVKFKGGADAGSLTALSIMIESHGHQSVTERENAPVIGQEFIFTYLATPEPDGVTVTGIFDDGSEQTILKTQV
jgi:hypothetical protein